MKNAIQDERISEVQEDLDKLSDVTNSVQKNTLALVRLEGKIDNVNEKCYIYAINKEKLETDGKLFAKLKQKIHNGSEMLSNVKIYATDYDEDYAYVIVSSSEIQTRE